VVYDSTSSYLIVKSQIGAEYTEDPESITLLSGDVADYLVIPTFVPEVGVVVSFEDPESGASVTSILLSPDDDPVILYSVPSLEIESFVTRALLEFPHIEGGVEWNF